MKLNKRKYAHELGYYVFWCKHCHNVEASTVQTAGIMYTMHSMGNSITCIKCRTSEVISLKVSEEFHDMVLQNSYKGNTTMSPHELFDQLL
jgi:hypothetical protein